MILENLNKFNAYYVSRRSRENYFQKISIASEIFKYWAMSYDIIRIAKEVSKVRGKYNLPTLNITVENNLQCSLIDPFQTALVQLRTQDYSKFICIEQEIDPSATAALQALYWCLKNAKDILEDSSPSLIHESHIKLALVEISAALQSKIFIKIDRKKTLQPPTAEILKLSKSSRFPFGVVASRLLISLKELQCFSASAIEDVLQARNLLKSSGSSSACLFMCFSLAESVSIVSGLPVLEVNIRESRHHLVTMRNYSVSIDRTLDSYPVVQVFSSQGDVLSHLVWVEFETDETIANATSALITASRRSLKKSPQLYEAPLNHCFIIVTDSSKYVGQRHTTVNILDINHVLQGGLISRMKSVLHSQAFT
jgi:hypothetical protein